MTGRGDWMLAPGLEKKYQVPITQWKNWSDEKKASHVLWAITGAVRDKGVSDISEAPDTLFRVPHMPGTRK